jgi:hypothetical protein
LAIRFKAGEVSSSDIVDFGELPPDNHPAAGQFQDGVRDAIRTQTGVERKINAPFGMQPRSI